MGEGLKYVGASVPIHDAKEKVTGKTRYLDDMVLPGMLHAKLLLSDIAHGNIIRVDTSKAEALPGVVAVFTYKDAPDNCYNSHKWIDGMEVVKDERIFADKVRFYGDRVAAVVAADRHTAERAVKLIEVEYETLPVIIDPKEALRPNAVRIHENVNILFRKTLECGTVETAMQTAYRIAEDRVETPKIHHAAMETHVCLADIDSSGNMTVWTPCQVIFQVQIIVAEALGIPGSRVRVIKSAIGGSFGGKGQPVLEPVCAFLAQQLKRPVKLVMDRSQAIIGTRTRTKTIGTVRTAVDKAGDILARDIEMLVDAGAYFTNGDAVAIAMGKKAFKLYRIENQSYTATGVYTNTPIGGAARGYGSPQIHAVTEINCVNKGAAPFSWKERYNRPKDSGRYVRGVGMACCAHGNGYYGAYPDFITLSLRIAGDGYAILKGAFHDLGCGTNTTMMQIVAETLDMNIRKICIPEADTLVSPFDSAGTQASRVTEKMCRYAARFFECGVEDIVMENEWIWKQRNENNKLSYGELATIIQKKYSDEAGKTVTYQSPGNPTSYAANFAEVEVDTVTGRVSVLELLAVHDIGKAINTGFVVGQVQGAVQMGLGMALSEEITFDGQGKVQTTNFCKYHVMNAPDMPDIKVLLVEEIEETGPYGAKSVGEIATVATAPAVINAINHALGINIDRLPATPERIMEKLRARGDKNGVCKTEW